MAQAVVVDAMGGDDAPAAIVTGALLAYDDGVPVRLVGRSHALKARLDGRLIEVVHADDVVGMDESAVQAVRRSEASSLRVALAEVAQGRGSSVVSCGHTGAVLVAAMFDLGVLDGVDRPAVTTVLPRADGARLVLLDAGANVEVRPELMATFAVMGAAYAESIGIPWPRVGLLSNGSEPTKGTAAIRAAVPLIEATDVNFIGQVEPSTALEGGCDVLLADGFTGNVFLKSAEGAVQTMSQLLRAEIERNVFGWVGALLMRRTLRRLAQRVSWDAQGGGVLLGTRGTVVVGHGRANAQAVRHAIHLAHDTVRAGLVEHLTRGLASGGANQ